MKAPDAVVLLDPAVDALDVRMRRLEGAAAILAMACGGAALALAFQSVIVGVVAALAVVLVIALRPRRPITPRGPSQVDAIDALIAAGGLAIGVLLARATGSLTTGLGVFLIAAQALKLARPRVTTDTPVGLVIGLVLAAVATAEGVEPLFGGLLALDLAALLTATAARATAEDARAAGAIGSPTAPADAVAPASSGGRARAVVHHGLRLATLGVAALLLFFVAPRTGAMQFLPARRESRERTSGFSDRVGLGDIGRIQQSDAVALRIEVVRGQLPDQNDLYWRGCALDLYDGQSWSTTPMLGWAGTTLGVDGDALVDTLVQVSPGERAEINVFQEPIGARCLFTVGAVEWIRFRGQRPHVVDRDAMAAILCNRAPLVQIAYRLETDLRAAVPRLRITRRLEAQVRRSCLALPAAVDQGRLLAYAQHALTLRRVPPDAPPSRIAAALETHLAATNAYTLDAKPTPGVEPVQDFLLDRREGHCEYFASSLVVLMRVLGIPARLVTGFRGSDQGVAGPDTFTVRQRNAHAWVEVETEDGWRRYDPTPAASRVHGGVLGTMGDLVDWLELRWYGWIVALDGTDQRGWLLLLRSRAQLLLENLNEALAGGTGTRDAITALTALTLLVALGLTLAGAVWVRARARARALAVADPALAGEGLVREALDALARRGVPRRADETLLEVGRRAREALGPDVDALLRWAPVYHASRWGAAGSDPTRGAEASALREALRRLDLTPADSPRSET